MKYSIVVRTLNEEKYIGELIELLLAQTEIDKSEIIAIDSGSNDLTLDIISNYPQIKVLEIAKHEFSYGRALNRAIAASKGEIVVSISAHCVPLANSWLRDLGECLEGQNIAYVFGRQEGVSSPRNGHPSTRFSERRIFHRTYSDTSISILTEPFMNNANSAFKRSWWTRFPFCEALPGLEDLDFAIKAHNAGGAGVYCAKASVLHLHDENNFRVFRRFFREELSLIKISSVKKRRSAIFLSFVKDYASDLLDVASINDLYSRYFITITGYRVSQYFAVYLAHYGGSTGVLAETLHNKMLVLLSKGKGSIRDLKTSPELRALWN